MLIWLESKIATYSETVLYWTIEPEIGDNVSQFGYTVEISESLAGPWTVLYTDPIYAYGFIDTITQRGMIDQRIYYRVKATDFISNVFYSDPICLDEDASNYLTEYISEQESLMLRRLNGQECLHFARRKFGERCSNCYDKHLNKCILPKCPICFGTTFKGGYFAPVKIYINLDPQPKQIDKGDYTISEALNLTGWTSNKVILEGDDILIFLKKPNKRYMVDIIHPTSLNGNTVRQMLSLTQLKADNPGQLLPIDIDAYTLDEFSIFRREWRISCGL